MTDAANLNRNAGITTYAIGVGSLINNVVLNLIASQADKVSLVADFSQLDTITSKLVQSVCVGELRSPCNPACNSGTGTENRTNSVPF
jgi:hypothetical protein